MICLNMGKTKASVFPEPVFAIPITSLPLMIAGRHCNGGHSESRGKLYCQLFRNKRRSWQQTRYERNYQRHSFAAPKKCFRGGEVERSENSSESPYSHSSASNNLRIQIASLLACFVRVDSERVTNESISATSSGPCPKSGILRFSQGKNLLGPPPSPGSARGKAP